MKILQIHDNYKQIGGAETYFWNLINLLERKGHKIYVFAFDDQDKFGKIFTTLKLPNNRVSSILMQLFARKITKTLIDLTINFEPDIIHIHNNYLAPIPILKACEKAGIPTIQTVHDIKKICPSGWGIRKRDLDVCEGGLKYRCVREGCISHRKYLFKKITTPLIFLKTKSVIRKFIAPSKTLANYLEKYGFKNVIYLPYLVDINRIKPSKLPNQKMILYFGAIADFKGIFHLLDIFGHVYEKDKDIILRFVGSGPDLQRLKNVVKRKNFRKNVQILGKVPHKEIPKILEETQVTIVPSILIDISPNVVYESLAAGRGVIASNKGGLPDLVQHGKTGFIASLKDKRLFAKYILDLTNSRNLLEKFSKNARAFAEDNFSPEKHYSRIIKIYESLQ